MSPEGVGLVHYSRNNDAPGLPWSGPTYFGGVVGYQGVSLIQSNFGSMPGNLEVVAVNNRNQLVHMWRESEPPFAWSDPFVIATGVRGVPGLVQNRFGFPGNFEVVVPSLSGGLLHFWRNNNAPGLPWFGSTPFAQGIGFVDAVSLIQSNFGDSGGNLELAATASIFSQVYHIWRESGAWSDPFPIPGATGNPFPVPGATGLPALIQNRAGFPGNFELVVNLPSGLAHFWRNNESPGFPWFGPTIFDAGTSFDIPSMIQSNFSPPGAPGNLEVIAVTRASFNLAHIWRDSATLVWSPPVIVETGV